MTIKDVAEYSGVSVSTVSRVLNDHPDVSEAVRAKWLRGLILLGGRFDYTKEQTASLDVPFWWWRRWTSAWRPPMRRPGGC